MRRYLSSDNYYRELFASAKTECIGDGCGFVATVRISSGIVRGIVEDGVVPVSKGYPYAAPPDRKYRLEAATAPYRRGRVNSMQANSGQTSARLPGLVVPGK
jgi:hypothetical protein